MALLSTLQFRPNVSNKGKIFISCSDLFWQSSNRYLLLSTKHVQFQLNHCALFYFIIVPACFSCSTRRRRRYRELLIRETKRCRTRERERLQLPRNMNMAVINIMPPNSRFYCHILLAVVVLFGLQLQISSYSQVEASHSKSKVEQLPGFQGPLPFQLETGWALNNHYLFLFLI